MMVRLEVWSGHPGDWHAQLRDSFTGDRFGEEWIAGQRGAVIGKARKWLPLSHLSIVDVSVPIP
jgi:hypothetical protein